MMQDYQVKWTLNEEAALREAVYKFGTMWTKVADYIGGTKTEKQCQDKWKKIQQERNTYQSQSSRKNQTKWTIAEDILMLQLVERFGKDWDMIRDKVQTKTGWECRKRYEFIRESEFEEEIEERDLMDLNFYWSQEDEDLLQYIYKTYNGDWKMIMRRFVDRNKSHCIDRMQQMQRTNDPYRWNPDLDSKLVLSYMENRSFQQAAIELGKTLPQCEDRFNMIMKIFQSDKKKKLQKLLQSQQQQEDQSQLDLSLQDIQQQYQQQQQQQQQQDKPLPVIKRVIKSSKKQIETQSKPDSIQNDDQQSNSMSSQGASQKALIAGNY